jgi:hypothetical protein
MELGLSCHFTAMSTVPLLVATVGVTSLHPHATNNVLLNSPSKAVSFISVWLSVFVKQIFENAQIIFVHSVYFPVTTDFMLFTAYFNNSVLLLVPLNVLICGLLSSREPYLTPTTLINFSFHNIAFI